MDAAEVNKLKNRYRLNNIPRLLIAVVFLIWFVRAGLPDFVIVATAVFVAYTTLWAILVELEVRIIFLAQLRYLRIFVDSFGLTIGIFITGGAFSPGVITYAGTVGLASLYLTNRYAIFSMAVNFVFFNTVLALNYGGVIPAVNILGSGGVTQSTTMAAAVFANFIIVLYSVIMHLVIYPNYKNLHFERSSLQSRNTIMENELSLARKIQDALIPAGPPSERTAFLYEPMEQVGGDFFDFIRFDDSGKLGIFICDVSGHGVPAALLASMLKTIVLQAGDKTRDPALLLSYTNETLQGLTAGNFITAFYAVYDPTHRVLSYANAGHPFPHMASGGEVSQLSGHRSPPLGVLSNDALRKESRMYKTSEVSLPEKSRVFLYTDGLIEATAAADSGLFFEGDPLSAALLGGMQLSCAGHLERLYHELVVFHGGDAFNDDICVVCLEIA